jgi:drug/metabolite transporter (DMT)-like permease
LAKPSLNAFALVFYRVVCVAAMAAVFVARSPEGFAIARKRLARLTGIGVLVALHWWSFYGCIHNAGVAVAVTCLSTIPFFTAFLEPLLFRRKREASELWIGALVVVCALLLVQQEAHATAAGIALGMSSAVFATAFGTFNGIAAQDETPARLTFFELAAAALANAVVFLAFPRSFVAPWHIGAQDAGLLFVLAALCTLLPWMLTARVLRVLTPFTVAVATTLEPVYSVTLAYIFFPGSERLSGRFYAGAGSLVVLVLANSVLRTRRTHRASVACRQTATPALQERQNTSAL